MIIFTLMSIIASIRDSEKVAHSIVRVARVRLCTDTGAPGIHSVVIVLTVVVVVEK